MSSTCLVHVLVTWAMVAGLSSSAMESGCIPGYQPVGDHFCLNITAPGTWTAAARSCLALPQRSDDIIDKFDTIFRERNADKPSHTDISDDEINSLNDLIFRKLKQLELKEVWWFPNYTRNIQLNDPLWQDKLLYPYNLPQKYDESRSSDDWCYTLDSTKPVSACVKPRGYAGLSGICLRPRFEEFNLVESDSCPVNFFTGFGLHPFCLTVMNGHNFTWTGGGMQCDVKGGAILNQQGYRVVKQRGKRFCVAESLVPLGTPDHRPFVWWHGFDKKLDNSFRRVELARGVGYRYVGAVNLTAGEWVPVLHNHRFSCVICQTERVERPETAISLHQRNHTIFLNISNFDGRTPDTVTCYTDASTTFSSYPKEIKYKFTIQPHSESLSVLREEIPYKDNFFLRFIKGLPTAGDESMNVINRHSYNITLGNKASSLNVPLTVLGSGRYWCVGQNRITLEPLFTETVALEVPYDGRYLKYSVLAQRPQSERATEFSADLGRVLNISDGLIELKRQNQDGTEMLFHVTLPVDNNSSVLLQKLDGVNVKGTEPFTIVFIRNTDFCMEDRTIHSNGDVFHWNKTARGNVQIHRGVDNCTAAIRACSGDFIEGAFWMSPAETNWEYDWRKPCKTVTTTTPQADVYTTTTDHGTYQREKSQMFQKVNVSPSAALSSLNSFENISATPQNLQQVTQVLNELLISEESWQSPETVSSFFSAVDKVLSVMLLPPDITNVSVVTDSCTLLVARLGEEPTEAVFSFSSTLDEQSGNITQKSLKRSPPLSVVLPKSVTSQSNQVAFAIFTNGSTFQLNTSHPRVGSQVITIVVSSKGKQLKTFKHEQYIDIKFPSINQDQMKQKQCAFWDVNEGAWSTKGCILLTDGSSSIDVCRCYHLTSFAEIILGSQIKLAEVHRDALDVISIIGCSLSFLGFLIIAITAIVFKKWRAELGNKVLLNLTATMALQLMMYLLIDIVIPSRWDSMCVVHGALLHYSLLACFTWMLVTSVLQLLRLLTIHGSNVISYLLVKATIIGWGIPSVPVLLLLAWNTNFYTAETDGSDNLIRRFCFPQHLSFYLTVLAPLSIIIAINIAVYVVILCRIYSCFGWGQIGAGLQRHGIQDRTLTIRRLGTSIFLFFLFGLTWIFGLFAHISIFSTVFSYLFCISATLQGFVIFVFFFVIEKKSHSYWQCLTHQMLHTQEYQSTTTKSTTLPEETELHGITRGNEKNDNTIGELTTMYTFKSGKDS